MADSLIWLAGRSRGLFKILGISILVIGKYTAWPFILFGYKNILIIKIKLKKLEFKNKHYLIFIQKYLPGLLIVFIIVAVTTNNIFAQSYSAEEYRNRTLLSSLVASDESQWSEIIEEGPNTAPQAANNYLDEQGALQELVINTPFQDIDTIDTAGVSPGDSDLALVDDLGQGSEAISRSEPIIYTVEAGDVLGSIGQKFNVTVNTILWENNLNWSSTIRPGQKLTILPNSGINHEVKSGDTVLSVAKKYQVDVEKIISANKLADASDINIGDLLFIPDGVKPTQVVSSYQPAKPANVYAPAPSDSEEPTDTGTKFLWPTNSTRITQYFSWSHSGLDIGNKTGQPIYAAEAGKVERAGWSKGYGYNVVINHGNGIQTLYGHASELYVKTGDTVSRGEVIAAVGSTGWSTGPHVHFEVRVNDARKNPINYIK